MRKWPFYWRWAARSLARRPLFTITVVMLLSLAIGCNTAVFTLLNDLLLNPVPVSDPHSLVSYHRTSRDRATGTYSGENAFSYLDYRDFAARSGRFLSGLALYQWNFMNLSDGITPERIVGMYVSANYFTTLGVHIRHGRGFLPREDEPGQGDLVAVLSDGCSQRLFGGPERALGRSLLLNGKKILVVGVAPPGFKGTELTAGVSVWVPVKAFPVLSPFADFFPHRDTAVFQLIGRLRPGVSREQAEAGMKGIAASLAREYPKDVGELGIGSIPFLESVPTPRQNGGYATFGKALAVAVGLILLIAGFNVAYLLVLRGVERDRELSIAQAVGAARPALLARLLSENLLLFLLGGLASLPVGFLTLRSLWAVRPPELVLGGFEPELDGRALALAFVLTLVSGLLFGVWPAVKAVRADLKSALREERPPLGGSRWLEPLHLLVIVQVALTSVALIGAGLLLRNLSRGQQIDPGFKPDGLIVASLAPGDQGYGMDRSTRLFTELLERVRALPGVEAAGLSENRLLRGAIIKREVYPEGQAEAIRSQEGSHRVNSVLPGFFAAAGIPVEGRDFSAADCATCPPVVIINQALAERAWPGENAVGKRLRLDEPNALLREVVGVIPNTKLRYLQEKAPLFMLHLPLPQHPVSAMTLHVRSATGSPEALLPSLRQEVAALDPDLPLAEVDTMRHFVDAGLWQERILASLFTFLAGLAVVLSIVGMYGAMAYRILRRRREIAVRLAVGANRGQVVRSVVAEAALLAGVGVVGGLLLARYILSPLLANQLELAGVDPRDVSSFIGAAVLLWGVALGASFFPARRAANTDPFRALRAGG